MKKIIFPICITTVSLTASCKKDYVCYCTETSTGQKIEQDRFNPSPISPLGNVMGKRDIKESCDTNPDPSYYSSCELVQE